MVSATFNIKLFLVTLCLVLALYPQQGNAKAIAQKRQAVATIQNNWVTVCAPGTGDKPNQKRDDSVATLNIQNSRPTRTIDCASSTATATVTATAAPDNNPPSNKKPPPSCNAQCWSDYLWHTYGYGISPQLGLIGIVCILTGLYFMAFGFRCFRATLALTGFVIFACMTWIGLTNNEPYPGYPNQAIVYICVCVGLGILGSIIFMFFYCITLYFVGALGGFYLAIFILSWKDNLVITNNVARICFIIGVAIIAGVSVFLLERYIIIFATSFIGAYLFIFGLDLFVHTGFINGFRIILDHNWWHNVQYMIDVHVYLMLGAVILLTLISCGWQYYWNVMRLHRFFGINVVEAVPVKA